MLLRRIKYKLDCTISDPAPRNDADGVNTSSTTTTNNSVVIKKHQQSQQPDGDDLTQVLWLAYLMMLENDGKNERQLREYAGIDGWLKDFWFDANGASRVVSSVSRDEWPSNHENMCLGMWLFWLLLRPGEYIYVVCLALRL